mgnify:CR=1 FL=1
MKKLLIAVMLWLPTLAMAQKDTYILKVKFAKNNNLTNAQLSYSGTPSQIVEMKDSVFEFKGTLEELLNRSNEVKLERAPQNNKKPIGTNKINLFLE